MKSETHFSGQPHRECSFRRPNLGFLVSRFEDSFWRPNLSSWECRDNRENNKKKRRAESEVKWNFYSEMVWGLTTTIYIKKISLSIGIINSPLILNIFSRHDPCLYMMGDIYICAISCGAGIELNRNLTLFYLLKHMYNIYILWWNKRKAN